MSTATLEKTWGAWENNPLYNLCLGLKRTHFYNKPWMDFQTWPVIEADNVTAESASILTALAVASQRSRRGMKSLQYVEITLMTDYHDSIMIGTQTSLLHHTHIFLTLSPLEGAHAVITNNTISPSWGNFMLTRVTHKCPCGLWHTLCWRTHDVTSGKTFSFNLNHF